MNKLEYFKEKITSAWKSKTLKEKSIRFLVNQIKRYFIIPSLSIFLSNKKLNLNFNEGYKDHRLNKDFLKIKPEQIERIIRAYEKSKLDQKNTSSQFKIKGLWEEWISINYKNLIKGLETKNVQLLIKIFNNILREECTRGLGSYDEWQRYNSLLGKNYIKYVWLDYYKKLKDIQGNQKIKFSKAGNPCGVIFDNQIIPIETLRHAYRAQEIVNCLKDFKEKIIVEIGGGYGGLIFQLASKLEFQKNNKLILFDIPEVAAISSSFLLSSFPDKKICLYGESPISSDSLNYEIGIFPHFSIKNLKDSSVDLFYNSCSFSEMDEASSAGYLSEVERCCKKYFMHDNHEKSFVFYQDDGTVSKNIIGSKLIPNEDTFKLIYKKGRTHYLPEDSFFKSFEYLYEKI